MYSVNRLIIHCIDPIVPVRKRERSGPVCVSFAAPRAAGGERSRAGRYKGLHMAPSSKSAYHHGDLRDTLIEATLALIETRGVDGFSLREVGRQAGVSPRAPYHHFENRAALLAVVAQHGYEQLGAALQSAAQGASGAGQLVPRLIDAYVEFAQQQRAHFQLMFRPAAYQKDAHPEVSATGDRAIAVVLDALAASLEGQIDRRQLQEIAVLVWSVAHGLASLLNDGALDRRSALMKTSPQALAARVARSFGRLLAKP
jgi:AcrR family transcriptional regulator